MSELHRNETPIELPAPSLAPRLRRGWRQQKGILPVTLAALGLLLATGGWLHWADRTMYGSFGVSVWLHVAIGWIAVPIYALYQVLHIPTRWASARPRSLLSGLASVTFGLVLFGSGIGLVWGSPQWPISLERGVHLWTTIGMAGLLLVHAGPVMVRWLRRVWRG